MVREFEIGDQIPWTKWISTYIYDAFLISERAVTPNDSTDEDESSDDEDEVNEISFEFRENPGWLAFSDSD